MEIESGGPEIETDRFCLSPVLLRFYLTHRCKKVAELSLYEDHIFVAVFIGFFWKFVFCDASMGYLHF